MYANTSYLLPLQMKHFLKDNFCFRLIAALLLGAFTSDGDNSYSLVLEELRP